MDTTFLHTFLLVVDTGSMAGAARALDLTAAAVAQQVKALEKEMGTALFSRAGRTVRPTEAGYRMVDSARSLVQVAADLKAVVNTDVISGELRLGTINTALHSLVPDILARVVKAHPQLKVFIQPGMSVDLFEAVQRGELDVAVCLHPKFALPKTCSWLLLREEPLIALVPSKFSKRDPHELLRSEPLIRYDRNQWGGRQADRYLRHAGITPNERFELSSLAAIAMMVDRGLGVSLVPDVASPMPAESRLTKLPLPAPSEPRRVGVVWRRSSARSRLIKVLVDSARVSAQAAKK